MKRTPYEKWLRRLRRQDEFRDILFIVGIATLVVGGVFIAHEYSNSNHGDALTLFGFFGLVAMTCFALWRYFHYLMFKTSHICHLVHIGINEAEARRIFAQEKASDQMGKHVTAWWVDYDRQHCQDIAALDKEFKTLLTTQYKIKPDWLEEAYPPNDAHMTSATTLLHHKAMSAKDIAQGVYSGLVQSGQRGNPAIFQDSAGAKKGKPSTFNSLVYGYFNPSRMEKNFLHLLFFIMALLLFGIAGRDFTPSDLWRKWTTFLVPILSMGFFAYGVVFRISMKENVPKLTKLMLVWLIPFFAIVIYGVMWAAVTMGIGSAATILMGEPQMKTFSVTKTVHHHASQDRYCFENAAFHFQKCLGVTQEEFILLPETVHISLTEMHSPLGVLKGEYSFSLVPKTLASP